MGGSSAVDERTDGWRNANQADCGVQDALQDALTGYLSSVELFSGAGGLAMGISQAGFRHEAVVERDRFACDTIRENQLRGIEPVVHWPLIEGDVCKLDYSNFPRGIDVLAGGPPCQPFSIGGKHQGYSDDRDMFPEVVRATRELAPRSVLFENVRGLLRPAFARYFAYIVFQISYPEITRFPDELWSDHLGRLERHHTSTGECDGRTYRVRFGAFNAADYGVPQKRYRVIIVGFRSDLEMDWCFPQPTHSLDALLWDQWVRGDYWERHEVATKDRPDAPAWLAPRVARLRGQLWPPTGAPWVTVRDAIGNLPDPEPGVEAAGVLNHRLQAGAKSYAGHTGSPLDEPAKALKAGDHGVPGGENMLAFPDGRVRYFTVRESARIQTFPDDFLFHGSWTETMRQLGNAVPVTLARVLASSIRQRLGEAEIEDWDR